MTSRFTKRVQEVLSLAKSTAENQGYDAPTALHILTALLYEKGGSAITILRRSGIDLRKLRSNLELLLSSPEKKADDSGCLSEIIDLAQNEARRFNMKTTGTAHLLLGILTQTKNIGAIFLRKEGIELLKMRQLTRSYMGKSGSVTRPSPVQRPSLFAITTEYPGCANPEKMLHRTEYEKKIITALNCFETPYVVLTGTKGSGKSSIIKGVIRRLESELSPTFEVPKIMLKLDLFRLVGWKWQRAQQKIIDFLNEINREGPFILIINDLDLFCRTNQWEHALFFLRLLIANSKLPIIIECDAATYDLLAEDDSFLSSRLTLIKAAAPCGEEALKILYIIRDKLESFHGIRITDEAVEQALAATANIKEDAFQFAYRILDLAASEIQSGNGIQTNTTLSDIEEKLSRFSREKREAIEMQDYKHAAQIRDEEIKLRDQKTNLSLVTKTDLPETVDESMIDDLIDRFYPQLSTSNWSET